MSASAAFIDLLEQLDMWWPEGDGNALREAADAWNKTAELIDEITGVLDAVATRLTDNYRGEAADRFTQTWARWVDPHHHGYLGLTAADCRQLAAALTDFASDVDIADRTLVQFVEQALSAAANMPNPLNPMLIPHDWLNWLRNSGGQLFTHLSVQTCALTGELDSAAATCSLPPAPGDQPDLSTIISTNITWPDPGKPTDLTGVATGEVNFGAGQGFGVARPTPPGAGSTEPSVNPAVPPSATGMPSNASGQPSTSTASPLQLLVPQVATQVIPQDGSSLPVLTVVSAVSAPPTETRTTPPSAESTPTGAEPINGSESVNGITAPLSDQAFDKLVDDLFSEGRIDEKPNPAGSLPPKLVPIPPATNPFKPRNLAGNFNPNPTLFRASAITDNVPQVPQVGSESVSFGVPSAKAIPAAATLATGAGAIATAKSRGSGFPMMPMGGGAMAGGDDSNEPKRAGRKRAVTPPPIVQ